MVYIKLEAKPLRLGQSREAEMQGTETARHQFYACRCERSSVTGQIQRMATLHSVTKRDNALNVSICFKGLLLPNLYKIWWKAKWNLECQGRSEGIAVEKRE